MSKEVLILTGMSGAGRSTVAHALEDLGWYVVDNLPPTLLSDLINQGVQSEISALAVVVDVRGGKFFDELASSLAHLKKSGTNFRVAFLDATDQALVQRFESTRRPIRYKVRDESLMESQLNARNSKSCWHKLTLSLIPLI